MAKIKLSPMLSIEESALTESFVRASGPGGQNVNKVATAVELRLDLHQSGLPEIVQERAAAFAGHRLNSRGVIVIHAHEHRTQLQNREAARERLNEILVRASRLPRTRRATKPTAVAREKRLKAKHVRSAVKRRRVTPNDDE